MNNKTVILDVREDLRNGREPFPTIMSTVVGLRADEQLLLIVPFEPTPLFDVMERRGFRRVGKMVESGDWEVLFTRVTQSGDQREEANSEMQDESLVTSAATEIVELDARGLEPPQPLIKILETVSTLAPGAELRARTDRRPMHLYPQLEERGFAAKTKEESDGSFLTQIRRR